MNRTFRSSRSDFVAEPVHGGSRCLDFRTTSEERPIRVIRRAPDRITEFGAGRFVCDSMMMDVHVSDLPDPRPGDLIVIGTDSFTIQGEPVRDRERLIWTLDLRPS